MKTKAFLFILIIVFNVGIIFAQGESIMIVNESFVNNSDGTSIVKVYRKGSPPDEIQADEYVKAVLNGEIGLWKTNPSYLEAYKAFAIAARTILLHRSKYGEGIRKYMFNGIEYEFDVYNDTRDQVFLEATKEEPYGTLIETAVSSTKDLVIKHSQESYPNATFFGSTGDFTKNSEERGWGYIAYLRKSRNDESGVFPPGSSGHGIGMSQAGAMHYAAMGWNYEQILKHYYHSAPPYLKHLKIIQADSVIYEKEWKDDFTNAENPIRTLGTLFPESIANGNDDLKVMVKFSEQISNQNLSLKIGNIAGVFVRDASDRKKASGNISIAAVKQNNLVGEQTFSLNALHRYAASWGLDSNPMTISFDGNSNYEDGADTLHQITIDASEPEIVIENALNKPIPPDVGGTQDTYLCITAKDDGTGLSKLEIYKDGIIWFVGTSYFGYLPEDGLYTIKVCDVENQYKEVIL